MCHTKQRARSASFLLSRNLLAATAARTAQQGTSAADWTTPRCGPAFMQKDTRRLLASAFGAELGRSDVEASAAGDGDGDDGGGESAAAELQVKAQRWPVKTQQLRTQLGGRAAV